MKIEIKNRFSLEMIFSGEFDSLKLAVEHCVKTKISLDGARLDGASLVGASLVGASLVGASLVGASLVGASLVGASLDGASLDGASLDRASLVGASLVGASLVGASLVGASLDGASLDRASLVGASLVGASLVGASLVGASLVGASLDGASLDRASLDGASLDGARLDGARLDSAPFAVKHIDAKVLAAIETPGNCLKMENWHSCETTHCRGGWAIVLAGESGKCLQFTHGIATAANLIYAASRPGKPMPNFSSNNEDALADIRKCAAEDPIPA